MLYAIYYLKQRGYIMIYKKRQFLVDLFRIIKNTCIIYCKYTSKLRDLSNMLYLFLICCQSISHLQYIKDI